MATTAFDVVLKEIAETRESIARSLIGGGAADYASYRHMCGEIQGLSKAHAYIEDLVRKMENDDDE